MEIEKRIRVRMVKRDGSRNAGQVYNLPGAEARRLIEYGIAETLVGPGETKPFGPSETKPLEPSELKRSKKKPRISENSGS